MKVNRFAEQDGGIKLGTPPGLVNNEMIHELTEIKDE